MLNKFSNYCFFLAQYKVTFVNNFNPTIQVMQYFGILLHAKTSLKLWSLMIWFVLKISKLSDGYFIRIIGKVLVPTEIIKKLSNRYSETSEKSFKKTRKLFI